MSGRTIADGLRWARQGTEWFLARLDALADADLSAPSGLPGWTRAHLAAHVAGNAQALSNLVHWARTGVETPMYASPRQRDEDIVAGARRPPADLRAWVRRSAAELADGFASLSQDQWERPVRTIQGRTLPASEVPWLRSREVMVHTVDLAAGMAFPDLPADFLACLVDDIVARRSTITGPALILQTSDGAHRWTVKGAGAPTPVRGSLPGLAAYLAGRPYRDVTAADGGPPPVLPPWL